MTENNWQSLSTRSIRPIRSVLSVYLNVDQSRGANLNRGFETQFRDMMVSLRNSIEDVAEVERFRQAERRLGDFLKAYAARARTLVMFFDQSDGFFWHQGLDVPIQNLARWDRQFLLRPLAAAADDFERYGVVLVDRANARLFTVFLGDIEEVAREEFDPMKVRHLKTAGTDHLESASRLQRKADEQVRRNLRQAIRDLESLVGSRQVERLVLAGVPELTSELKNLLPKRLAFRVIGSLDLAADASRKDVLDATLGLAQKYERAAETQVVNEVTTAAAKHGNAVAGLGNTLKKVNEARLWQLIYSEDFHAPGFECGKCGALFSIERESCHYCGAELARVNDIVECAVERAMRHGARIEVVRGEAAASLDTAGGIGAFLKARTKAVHG